MSSVQNLRNKDIRLKALKIKQKSFLELERYLNENYCNLTLEEILAKKKELDYLGIDIKLETNFINKLYKTTYTVELLRISYLNEIRNQ